MGYFNNPRSEEELKDQFRKLLIKYDYRNPKNQKLIAAIRREYDQELLNIKRANGYQTFGDKVKAHSDKVKQERQQERQRVAQLQNKQYTKQDFTDLVNREKRYIDNIIKKIVSTDRKRYHDLRFQLAYGENYIELYEYFNNQSMFKEDERTKATYTSIREEIEYAVDHLSSSKKQSNELMRQVEVMMGKYIYECFTKYETLYVDPIEIQQADSAYGVAKNKKNMEKESTGANFLIKIAIPPMIGLGIIALLSGEPIALPLFTAPFILWIVVIKLWDIFVAKPLTKRARRVRTKQQAENTGSILKILGRIVQHLFFH